MNYKKVMNHMRCRIPMNLQFFGEGDGAGTSGAGGGSGADAGTGAGAGTSTGAGGDSGAPTGGTGTAADKPKTFDELLADKEYQAEFDRRIQKALNTQRDKLEVLYNDKATEAEKLAKMTEAEKTKYLAQKREKELTGRESEITRRELAAEAKNTLVEKKLPVGLAEILNYTDAESCSKSIETVEKAFQEAVEAAVKEKLKGGEPPKAVPGGNTVLYTQAQVSAMSPEEINKNWESVSQSMKTW